MGTVKRARKGDRLSVGEIDQLIVAESENESAWTKPVQVRRAASESLALPHDVALRAEFFSRLHKSKNLNDWLRRIIQERLDLEEAVFQSLSGTSSNPGDPKALGKEKRVSDGA